MTDTVYVPIFKVIYLNYLRKTTKTTVRLTGLLEEYRRHLKLRLFKDSITKPEVIYSGISNVDLSELEMMDWKATVVYITLLSQYALERIGKITKKNLQ